MKLFKRDSKENSLPALSKKDIQESVVANKYVEEDDVTAVFDKYIALCELYDNVTDREGKNKVHQAQLLFINAIQAPKEKNEILEMISNTILYVKSSLGQDAMRAASTIGFTALKIVKFAGAAATLGMANKALTKAEELANKAMRTDAEELTKAWRSRARVLFDAAKKMTGGMFNEDKAFAMQLKELKKQYDEIIK